MHGCGNSFRGSITARFQFVYALQIPSFLIEEFVHLKAALGADPGVVGRGIPALHAFLCQSEFLFAVGAYGIPTAANELKPKSLVTVCAGCLNSFLCRIKGFSLAG